MMNVLSGSITVMDGNTYYLPGLLPRVREERYEKKRVRRGKRDIADKMKLHGGKDHNFSNHIFIINACRNMKCLI